jgi:aspartate/tyrosine/aromatic aminotransferase
MFSFTGLNEKQCVDILIKKYHIHLVKNGRISMAGVNSKNVQYIAQAIKEAVLYQP